MITYIMTSNWLESNPTPVYFVHRLLEIGCNFLFSIPVFKLLDYLDDKFKPEADWVINDADQQQREIQT